MYLLKIIFLIFCVNLINGQCVVNRNLLDKPIPLLVDSHNKPIRIQYNNNVAQFVFNKNDAIMVVCSNSFVCLKNLNSKSSDIIISCNSRRMFTYDGKSYDLKDITCSKGSGPCSDPSFQVGNCLNGKKLITVGFDPKHKMIPTYRTCYDHTLHQVLYTDYELRPDHRKGWFSNRPPWFGMKMNGISINSADFDSYYHKKEYTRTLTRILGKIKGKLVSDHGIDKGHIVPFSDFLYVTQRESTMGYMNVAPQWHKINTGSWNKLEQNVRNYCFDNKRNLNVITGTWGILELSDDRNISQKLFLAPHNKVPIPKLFWKAVYDRISNKGKVFISVNNPLEKELKPLCNNICPQAVHSRDDELIYCCRVSDFISRAEFNDLSTVITFRPSVDPININP